MSRRLAVTGLAASLAACGRGPTNAADAPPEGSLGWAIAGPWRIEPERDRWRHPLQTLLFWGLEGDMTVLEVLPGVGWYTSILAPYLARNGGRLIAASFDSRTATPAQRDVLSAWSERFTQDERRFGDITQTIVAPGAPLAPAGSVDLAIITNTINTLMAEGVAERVFADVRAALKPGGVLGVEQHRASSTGVQSPSARSGYVQEEYVKTLAQEAGLDFVAASDINANPRDTRDHPFGVWTLPPTLRTSDLGQPEDPSFDTTPFAAVGESDRMTLKFRKPAAAPESAP